MLLWQLFLSFLQIGAFSFGGGYAAIPLIQKQIIHLHHWMSAFEFNNLIAISQMTPGPIAINSATFVGLQISGFFGALCATFACVLPSCIIVSILARIYIKYKNLTFLQEILSFLRPVVVSLIASAGGSMIISSFWQDGNMEKAFIFPHLFMFLFALWLLQKKKCNPILTMLLLGFIECAFTLLF
ncbi:MAG: chromate transporter [Erysipelotrichia bacterium]|nr:chromate transporter [Erysipelotrichia bacterium]NCC54184.1 chromate transporter [Erysipelotrichia bacterium]